MIGWGEKTKRRRKMDMDMGMNMIFKHAPDGLDATLGLGHLGGVRNKGTKYERNSNQLIVQLIVLLIVTITSLHLSS